MGPLTELPNSQTTMSVEITDVNPNLNLLSDAKKYQENPNYFNYETIIVFEPGDFINIEANENNNFVSGKYGFIAKIGHGSDSIVWLVVDIESKDFKVLKLFKYKHWLSKRELQVHELTQNHPNILHYYRTIIFEKADDDRKAYGALYEPLGKNLQILMDEASKNGGLSIDVIKKVAKDILTALKIIHEDCKIIHADIDPTNIVARISQKNLYDQLKNILKSQKSLEPFRMSFKLNTAFNEPKIRKILNEYLNILETPKYDETKDLTFKLIDFGNATIKCNYTITGSYGFRPPEYFFGGDLTYSHDIWALGITFIQLFICRNLIPWKKANLNNEINDLTNIFGLPPREWYSNCTDPHNLKENFTKNHLYYSEFENGVKKILRKVIESREMSKIEKKKVNDFFFHMLHFNPSKRKNATELLAYPWLNDSI